MVKLPPMIGSCIVACAFTRHVFFGSFEGKKTVKPRFASTSDQSEIVLGVPGAAVAVVVAVGPEPPTNKLVHEARNKFDRSRKVVICNHANLSGEWFNLDKIRGTIIKSPVCQAISLEK